MQKKIIIISGPTASGKTAYSIEVAKKNNGVILNADSIQIYKGLPILSAQPTKDEMSAVEHLLFSFLDPTENSNVGIWLKLIQEKIQYCFDNNKLPIIVGGTGLYISKLINGIIQIPDINIETREETIKLYEKIGHDEFYKKAIQIDEQYTKKLNNNDKQRLMRIVEIYKITKKPISYFTNQENVKFYPEEMFFHININPPKDILYARCLLRFQKMINESNVLNEIENFRKNYPEIINKLDKYSVVNTIGLNEGFSYLNNQITINDFIEKSVKITKNYAKRQYTWFNNQFDKFDLRFDEIANTKTEVPILA